MSGDREELRCRRRSERCSLTSPPSRSTQWSTPRTACSVLGGCEPGDAKATPAFRLPARFIIHTVGPVWCGGDHGEVDVLGSCYRRSIEVAGELGVRSIAFPAISTGAFGFPEEQAAQIAVDTLRSVQTSVQQVLLVAFDRHMLQSLERALTR
jgi:O-acetyl-ADP-ribose deacetylase (regulator of RNase III)